MPRKKESFYVIWFVENNKTVALTDDLQAAIFLRRDTALKQAKKISKNIGLKTKVTKILI